MEERLEELLRLALQQQASDLHLFLKAEELTLELRTPQRLIKLETMAEDRKLIPYIKYLAHIDLGNPLLPQSGSCSVFLGAQEVFLRVAVLSSTFSESLVIRVLNARLTNERISYVDWQNQQFAKVLAMDYGLVLFSGPTGSGKTTSLYTLLNLLAKCGKKVFTIEDPIEIYFSELTQIQVNLKKELSYEAGIKQLLRHDPDVIAIGEIRDSAEAAMAIRAALTGHLVLSSIHAKDILGVFGRLRDLGIRDLDLFDTLRLVSNQRLYWFDKWERRIALYEILDEDGIRYLEKNQRLPADFQALPKDLR
ncbi:MAG: Flp pilus assembly complex ATPase component TadA [Erysipelotrichaceae bacterium]|jgi:competence protein ComGA|nr:Flp pilus assembly complex ATPase component TadA [Erysipelotrichaceae bacterium]